VQIPREADADNRAIRTITITGPTHEATDAAQQEVYALLNEAAAVSATTISSSIQVPNDRCACLYGGVCDCTCCTIPSFLMLAELAPSSEREEQTSKSCNLGPELGYSYLLNLMLDPIRLCEPCELKDRPPE
jgi:hypothetical protein